MHFLGKFIPKITNFGDFGAVSPHFKSDNCEIWGEGMDLGHPPPRFILYCYHFYQGNSFLWRVSILTHDIDIANLSVCLSVRNVPVSDENDLTYCDDNNLASL